MRADISAKLGKSFDALAMVAMAKIEIHDSQTGVISTLTSINSTLMATNATLTAGFKKLTAEILLLKLRVKVPPGFATDTITTEASKTHAMNTSGLMCPGIEGGGTRKAIPIATTSSVRNISKTETIM